MTWTSGIMAGICLAFVVWRVYREVKVWWWR